MIKFLDLQKVTQRYSDEIQNSVARVVNSGWYLQGVENSSFEQKYSQYIGAKYTIGCANGLDALIWIFRAYIELGLMQPGDEIIVPSNTYIASILSITENGLIPVLVEPDINTYQIDDKKIEAAITNRTKAILIVHLYGQCAYTEKISTICKKFDLKLVEDNAQAHGCIWGNQKTYVFQYTGRNSRLDEIQAAVLNVKLKYLDKDNGYRKKIARYYIDNITNSQIILPKVSDWNAHVFHIFPVRCKKRNELQSYLAENGIQTIIHYPIPPHKQECYKAWNNLSFPVSEIIHKEELSLPISPVLTDVEAKKIVSVINQFK